MCSEEWRSFFRTLDKTESSANSCNLYKRASGDCGSKVDIIKTYHALLGKSGLEAQPEKKLFRRIQFVEHLQFVVSEDCLKPVTKKVKDIKASESPLKYNLIADTILAIPDILLVYKLVFQGLCNFIIYSHRISFETTFFQKKKINLGNF